MTIAFVGTWPSTERRDFFFLDCMTHAKWITFYELKWLFNASFFHSFSHFIFDDAFLSFDSNRTIFRFFFCIRSCFRRYSVFVWIVVRRIIFEEPKIVVSLLSWELRLPNRPIIILWLIEHFSCNPLHREVWIRLIALLKFDSIYRIYFFLSLISIRSAQYSIHSHHHLSPTNRPLHIVFRCM